MSESFFAETFAGITWHLALEDLSVNVPYGDWNLSFIKRQMPSTMNTQ